MVDFVIDHLDPLGQGVSKRVDRNHKSTITFVPKTLPGEQGKARVIKSAKGVEFAVLESLANTSPQRIAPECEHYAQCSGCDYLHVRYEDEIAFKQQALQYLLRALPLEAVTIEVLSAPERFGYRNRVQLHYRHKYLGLIDANADQVLEVPHCKLVSPSIGQAMDALYRDRAWTQVHAGRGHVELYEKEGTVQVEWNAAYASGGFSQVNPAMNDALRRWLQQALTDVLPPEATRLLDLFSGAGNLSQALAPGQLERQLVDSAPWPGPAANDCYLQLDLYADEALDSFLRRAKQKEAELLLLDPPRKGFPALAAWATRLKPHTIAYVSCNPATLARDLQALFAAAKKVKYRIARLLLLDMFPGTRHYETVVVLSRR